MERKEYNQQTQKETNCSQREHVSQFLFGLDFIHAKQGISFAAFAKQPGDCLNMENTEVAHGAPMMFNLMFNPGPA